MSMTPDDWPDIWSEYRPMVFGRLGMDHARARTFVADALDLANRLGVTTDGDTVADAIKEFTIRRGARDLRAELISAAIRLRTTADAAEQHAIGVRLFGCRAEDIGPVLAHLDEVLR